MIIIVTNNKHSQEPRSTRTSFRYRNIKQINENIRQTTEEQIEEKKEEEKKKNRGVGSYWRQQHEIPDTSRWQVAPSARQRLPKIRQNTRVMRLRFLGATYLSFMCFCACFYSVMSCDFSVFFVFVLLVYFSSCLFLSFMLSLSFSYRPLLSPLLSLSQSIYLAFFLFLSPCLSHT